MPALTSVSYDLKRLCRRNGTVPRDRLTQADRAREMHLYEMPTTRWLYPRCLVLTIHCIETWCRVEINCIARARPRFLGCRGASESVTIFVTVYPHNPHTQCNAMQSRLAAYRRLSRWNPPAYAGIEYLHIRQGLVFVNRRSIVTGNHGVRSGWLRRTVVL